MAAYPSPPGLTFLYTSFVIVTWPILIGNGPHGQRFTVPIVGGNFSGPRLSGTILDVGADWGTVDLNTGIFSPHTRYNFQTDDGTDIYLNIASAAQPDGSIESQYSSQSDL